MTTKVATKQHDRGWFLHFRDDAKQWELCYRVGPGKWRKHRVPRQVGTENQAEKYATAFVDAKKKNGTLARPALAPNASVPPADGPTFEAFAREWTNGNLFRRHPDHVRAKRTAADDATRVDVLSPAIGSVTLKRFTLDDAEGAMRRLDDLRQERENEAARRDEREPRKLKPLSPASRRQYAQIIHRILALATYPARLIDANPLPKGFLPKPGGKRPDLYLYPDEDRKLLECARVPLGFRVLYGVLAREGMRASEALGLTWGDFDLGRGAVTLSQNKTDDPRAWALSPGVGATLKAWRNRLEGHGVPVDGSAPVFVQESGAPIDRFNLADNFRAHLRLAKVERKELFDGSKGRTPIRAHDLRATFVTVSLATGKTEAWVSARTGHRSSQMINRYRRAAQKVEELSLGGLTGLDEALPEVASTSDPDSSPDRGQATRSSRSKVDPRTRQLVAELVAAGLSRGRPAGSKRREALEMTGFPGVGRAGHDPATYGLKVRSSTN